MESSTETLWTLEVLRSLSVGAIGGRCEFNVRDVGEIWVLRMMWACCRQCAQRVAREALPKEEGRYRLPDQDDYLSGPCAAGVRGQWGDSRRWAGRSSCVGGSTQHLLIEDEIRHSDRGSGAALKEEIWNGP